MDWSDGRTIGPNFVPWVCADADSSDCLMDMFSNLDVDGLNANIDLDGEVKWYNWVVSAKWMEYEECGVVSMVGPT